MTEEALPISKQTQIARRALAGVIDCLIVGCIDCALMYIAWLLGMTTGALDSNVEHWMQLLQSVPIFIADGITVILIPLSLVYLNVVQAWDVSSIGVANLLLICCMAANWLYHVLFECSDYRGTLGKQVVGLSVVDSRGEAIDFGTSSLRHFSKMLCSLTLGFGFLPLWGEQRNLSMHDAISHTKVVKE